MAEAMRKENEVVEVAKARRDERRAQQQELEPTREHDIGADERSEEPHIVDEICVEELAIDGICGVY